MASSSQRILRSALSKRSLLSPSLATSASVGCLTNCAACSSHSPLHQQHLFKERRLLSSAAKAELSPPASTEFHRINKSKLPYKENDTTGSSATVNFTVESVILNLEKAAQFNQGKGGRPKGSNHKWDVDFVRQTVEDYEHCIKYFYQREHGHDSIEGKNGKSPFAEQQNSPVASIGKWSPEMRELLLSPETTERAFRSMLRCRVPTALLSNKVREWEWYIGKLGQTQLTDSLSLRMLEANGKAGNIGRAMTLLSLRKSRDYPPTRAEFTHAITAIDSAGLYLRNNRNVFLPDKDQPQMDDPTRWLDAILINMNQRDFPLTVGLANRMLNTYASTGKSGKALHHFYRVLRNPIDIQPSEFVRGHEDPDDNIASEVAEAARADNRMAVFRNKPVQVRLSMRPPPPYHKIPSQVKGKLVHKPGTEVKQLKIDRESDPDWSPPLTAAISFADSLTHGACGHDPLELDLISYSILIKACVNRGSLWRAMHILDEVMPSNGVEPDAIAYNTLLWGLARVGDAPTMKEYFNKMHSKGIQPTKETVEAIVQGLLNLGDIATASTVVQDCFNQFSVLPPYTTHLKILEFALARGLVHEAKRHVFVIQQLWKWQPNQYHSPEFCRVMELTQKNRKLSKQALQDLFAYFGENLDDSNFI